MTFLGTVRVWRPDEGWGVIDSEATPGGCWVHFSSVLVAGYKSLAPGQEVGFTFEVADQDGFAFRALAAWPADQEPVRGDSETSGSTAAYRSALTLTVDDVDQDESGSS